MKINKLKTSKEAAEKLFQLKKRTGLNPNILCRVAVALSLRGPKLPNLNPVDSGGLEFNRYTLTGEYDALFHALISQHAGTSLTDEEYFATHLKAHIDQGVNALWREYDVAGNQEGFFIRLAEKVRPLV